MANKNEIDVLKDSTLVFKTKTITEPWDFNIPVLFFGGLGGFIGVLITLGIDVLGNPDGNFTPDAYLWSLLPMLNVLFTWPLSYGYNINDKLLSKKGYRNHKVSYWTALKSWYRIPTKNKKTLIKKTYVKVFSSPAILHGDLSEASVRIGQATHEVNDYLVNDFKGVRLERHVEPMPLMLWDDTLKTIDEGFGLQNIQ